MASISRRRPALATTAATSATGFSTPEVVSQWTTVDMGDGRVGGQRLFHRGRIDRAVLGPFQGRDGALVVFADANHALAIGAVDQDQQLAVRRHEAAEHRFDREGAAALHRHADMGPGAAGHRDQLLAHPAVDLDELGIARTPVMEHRLLHGQRGGERAGGEQPGIAR